MSGIDEQDRNIPQCPNCREGTDSWSIQSDTDNSLGYFNYNASTAEDYGEFNIISKVELVKKTAVRIQCDRCSLIDRGKLFKQAMNAWIYERRRFPQYVGD